MYLKTTLLTTVDHQGMNSSQFLTDTVMEKNVGSFKGLVIYLYLWII